MLAEAALVLGLGVLVWGYRAVKPPPPRICGSPNGPPVTSPRIKLSDGRHLAYKERGVPKELAKYKVILVHGFDSSKDIYLPLSQVWLHTHFLRFIFMSEFKTDNLCKIGIWVMDYE